MRRTNTALQAIHPGYGFLSENADFAAACERGRAGVHRPVGGNHPAPGLEDRGAHSRQAGSCPVVPGSEEPATNLEQARKLARELGYPVLLKAAAGGGGKGMRRVDAESELEASIRDAASEAERAFHNREIYIEKVIERPRHIEIQIAGDRYGNLVHLGERECSLQRRHQKIIEECPSPLVARNPEMRQEMGEAALRIARAAGYYNLGTVEFLVDQDGNFYFLEVNTRLQVEHPVTELVTGLIWCSFNYESPREKRCPSVKRMCAGAAGPWSAASARRIRKISSFLRPAKSCSSANRRALGFAWTRECTRAGPYLSNTIHCSRSWWLGRPIVIPPSSG